MDEKLKQELFKLIKNLMPTLHTQLKDAWKTGNTDVIVELLPSIKECISAFTNIHNEFDEFLWWLCQIAHAVGFIRIMVCRKGWAIPLLSCDQGLGVGRVSVADFTLSKKKMPEIGCKNSKVPPMDAVNLLIFL